MVFHMIQIIVYIFLAIFSLLAIFSCSYDAHLLLNGLDPKFTSIGRFWYELSPNSLQIFEVIVSRYIDPCSLFLNLGCSPLLWHPFISSILILPATPIFILLSLSFIWLQRRSRNQKTSAYFK